MNPGSSDSAMFSSMFVDSLMNTSMHIAQECMGDGFESPFQKKKTRFSESSSSGAFEGDELGSVKINEAKKESLLGLEAFASTIDSILSRIKINLENIQIRIENLDSVSHFKFNDQNIMSSSTMFTPRPSNGMSVYRNSVGKIYSLSLFRFGLVGI